MEARGGLTDFLADPAFGLCSPGWFFKESKICLASKASATSRFCLAVSTHSGVATTLLHVVLCELSCRRPKQTLRFRADFEQNLLLSLLVGASGRPKVSHAFTFCLFCATFGAPPPMLQSNHRFLTQGLSRSCHLGSKHDIAACSRFPIRSSQNSWRSLWKRFWYFVDVPARLRGLGVEVLLSLARRRQFQVARRTRDIDADVSLGMFYHIDPCHLT